MTQIAFNPVLTTNAQGTFNTTSEGFVQGVAMDDPSIRNKLSGGVLDADELIPMWGGVGVSNYVPGAGGLLAPQTALGTIVKRATLLTGAKALTGFSVFDQNHSAINSPQSAVPLVGTRMTLNYYLLGSGARIPLAMDTSLIGLDGGLITQQVSWDFENSRLVPYVATYGDIDITSQTWNAGIVTVVTAAPHPFGVGNEVNISGAAPAAYNGAKEILTAADNTHFTYAMPVDPGVSPAGTPGQVDAGGGALPVKILEVQVGNCMTVSYDPVTGFASWNRDGSCALVLI